MSSPTKNLGLVFTKVPMHFPLANEHVTVQDTGPFDLDQPLPSEDGSSGLILQTLYASLDPYLRGLLRDPAVKSYMPALPLGSPISAYTLSRVLRSNIPGYEEGDIVRLTLPIRQYNLFIYKPSPGQMKPFKVPDPNDPKLDMVHYLGALGMPGLTAYSSLYEIGKPQKGEIIVVSSAAGAVGQLVGQLAKHEGLTVLGSVGSDDKLKFIIEELGFDGGWNYKHEKSTKEAIERLVNEQTQKKGEKIPEEKVNGVGGIDIFYDNVGGEQLEGAIESLNLFGRIVACGQISQYNLPPPQRYGITNTFMTVSKRLTMTGFMVGDANMGKKHSTAHLENVSKWLRDGSFKAKVHVEGLERGAEAFEGMLRGENFGKAVLKVSD